MGDKASEVMQEGFGRTILDNFQVNCSLHYTGEKNTSGLSRLVAFIFKVKGPKRSTPGTENGGDNSFILPGARFGHQLGVWSLPQLATSGSVSHKFLCQASSADNQVSATAFSRGLLTACEKHSEVSTLLNQD